MVIQFGYNNNHLSLGYSINFISFSDSKNSNLYLSYYQWSVSKITKDIVAAI